MDYIHKNELYIYISNYIHIKVTIYIKTVPYNGSMETFNDFTRLTYRTTQINLE